MAKAKASNGSRARLERDQLAQRAFEEWERGRLDVLRQVAQELGSDYVRLDIAARSGFATLLYHPDGDAVAPEQTAYGPTMMRMPLDHAAALVGIGDRTELVAALRDLARNIAGDASGDTQTREEREQGRCAATAFGRAALQVLAGAGGAARELQAFNGCGGRRWGADRPARERGAGYDGARRELAAMVRCGLIASPRRGQWKLEPAGRRLASSVGT